MPSLYDHDSVCHFVTFSCFRRRRLLDEDRHKQIVIGTLDRALHRRHGICSGFVVMPEHVHAAVWFSDDEQLVGFMQEWKRRSSYEIRRSCAAYAPSYAGEAALEERGPVWQRRYYAFHIVSESKLREKVVYMHWNPVRRGLVEMPVEWPFSSARFYELGLSVGLPIGWPGEASRSR